MARTISAEAYINILRQHGRRVANRVALASMPNSGRTLLDFYRCYAPEDDLPEEEHCNTGMSLVFDPVGWFVYYESPDYTQHPEPPHAEQT